MSWSSTKISLPRQESVLTVAVLSASGPGTDRKAAVFTFELRLEILRQIIVIILTNKKTDYKVKLATFGQKIYLIVIKILENYRFYDQIKRPLIKYDLILIYLIAIFDCIKL